MAIPTMVLVLLPFLAAAAALPVAQVLGRRTYWWGIAVAGACLALSLSLFPSIQAGEPIYFRLSWVPLLGIDLSFYVDGLSLLYLLLVTGVGTLVLIYARYYMSPTENQARFYGSMLFFLGSMVGVVTSGNLILLFVFWEMTSISSYLLIGYWDKVERSRYASTQALLVTAGGGLAMLAGFIVLYGIVGSFDIPTILASREIIVASPLYPAALLLILVGAFTKSAQFPFHFWLPGAMVAPTPVSTYLHSATMVKAGLFLLARLLPALGGTADWTLFVTSAGIVTMLVGGYIAIKQTDLKALLAYSTVSQLGLIAALYGLGTVEAAAAATFHVFNHSAFKGTLFMIAGFVEHETGTRDLRQLGGLRRRMPVATVIAGIAALALAGIPPLNGFISKEMFFKATLHAPVWPGAEWWLPAVAVVGGTLTFLYSFRFWLGTFFGAERHPEREHHAPPPGFLFSPAFLAAICVVVGLYALPAETWVINPAVSAVVAQAVELHLTLWHGFNLPLLMSAAVVVIGAVLFWRLRTIIAWQERGQIAITAGGAYDLVYRFLVYGTPWMYWRLQNGVLRHYLMVIVGTLLGVVGLSLLVAQPPLRLTVAQLDPFEYALPILMIAAAIGTAALGERLAAVIALGVVGVLVSSTFILYSAPDLALTQLLIEIVSIVLFLLVFARALPIMQRRRPAGSRFADIVASVGVGGLMGALMLLVTSGPLYPSIRDYFIANTYEKTGGRNVVNVIIVDFRGYDTMGEITVLGIAAIALYCVVKLRLGKETK